MKLGILGGSFNPVHLGHLFLAETALSALKLDRVVFIPAYRSPFKLNVAEMETNTSDRINMLAASIEGDSRFAIDGCEIRREGVSYTVNTLEDVIERYMPTGKPVLIIGDDLAADFPKWRDSEKILQLADIAVARRINAAPVSYPFSHIVIENQVMNVSSQEIRQMIAESASGKESNWQSLVPAGAREIIEARKLYGLSGAPQSMQPENLPVQEQTDENGIQADIRRIERAARETLSTERFLHSRNTALQASDMCSRLGLNHQEGYLAGIAHDLAKQIDNRQLLEIVKSDGQEITSLENERPNLLHGKAAAVLLRERFNIHNKEVIDAVAVHTSGCEDIGQLAKVIYIADKTDASRSIDPALRKMCREDNLDNILLAVIDKAIIKIKAKGLELSEDTLKMLSRIKE
ncbi:MAG: nicotinate (nicotinamide) nucleotide adenylyltransferase [Treponema sp.]|nr:nicotinate (nicotinamide) nucleotide adenylyltransferase [Treponema sp.]